MKKKIQKNLFSNKSDAMSSIFVLSGFVFGITVLLPLWGADEAYPFYSSENYYIFYLLFALPFFILIFFNLYRYIKSPNFKYVIFDRENNLLTMPRYNACHYFSIPFHHLRATKWVKASGNYFLYFYNDTKRPLPWRNEKLDMGFFQLYKEPIESWSFYVWYMDKNRPLPTGSAFDEFRKQDFERRKAEGFPPPLFKSCIPTPEATAS